MLKGSVRGNLSTIHIAALGKGITAQDVAFDQIASVV